MLNKIYVALIHYPILSKENNIISTAVTNFDIHDISRTSKTYGIKEFFVVTNLPSQIQICENVLGYWTKGFGKRHNPNRNEALSVATLKSYLEDVLEAIEEQEGEKPKIVFTSAKPREKEISFEKMSEVLKKDTAPILILYGTGWGMPEEIRKLSHYDLEPIRGKGNFNHLSVRAAVAISLDRLIGEEIY
jgi:hypothetical protein